MPELSSHLFGETSDAKTSVRRALIRNGNPCQVSIVVCVQLRSHLRLLAEPTDKWAKRTE